MPGATEIAVILAKEVKRLEMLEIVKIAKDLEEAVKMIENLKK